MNTQKFYQLLSKVTPRKIRDEYHQLLVYADIRIRPDIYLGFWLFFGFLASLTISFFVSFVFGSKNLFFVLLIGLFIASQALVYVLLNLAVDSKAHFVEMILPDVLQLMASNLRAGMTIDRALLLAARPEFGSFQKELVQVGKEIATGRELDVALMNLTKRIRSDQLRKTVTLIISGLHAGGQLASLLEQTSKNLRSQQFLEEKVKSSVGTYVIFVTIAIGFGAPLLFGLSTVLVEVLSSVLSGLDLSSLEGSGSASVPITFSKIVITKQFVIMYSLISLASSSLLGSMVIGLINRGKAREGLRYSLGIMLLAFTVYFMVYVGVKGIFTSLGLI